MHSTGTHSSFNEPGHRKAVMRARHAANSYICALFLALLAGSVVCQSELVWDKEKSAWVDSSTGNAVSSGSAAITAGAAHQQAVLSPAAAAAAPFNEREFLSSCGKSVADKLTQVTTECDYINNGTVSCQQLADQGRIAAGAQSFLPSTTNGNFTVPIGCGDSPVVLSYNTKDLVFYSPKTPVLAVIAKDAAASKVFMLGSGVSQGKVQAEGMSQLELCFAPASLSPVYITQTASYSMGLTPGTAAWALRTGVQLPAAFSNGVVNMFTGDTVDVAWTLGVTKTGSDTTYQGMVTGQIILNNNQAKPVAVYSVSSNVQGGPVAQIKCGTTPPFWMPACASTVCNFVAYYPRTPFTGSYQTSSSANYQLDGTATVGTATGMAAFQVDRSEHFISNSEGQVPEGQAVVTDSNLPGQSFKYQGSGHQSYVTTIKCPASGTVKNSAVLLASTGQEVSSSTSVLKNCFDLTVRLGDISTPSVARYIWTVKKTASVSKLRLRGNVAQPGHDTLLQQQLAVLTGQDLGSFRTQQIAAQQEEGGLSADVTYTVQYTRTPPSSLSSGDSPFSVTGTVTVTNPAPVNAKLAGVAISINNPSGKSLPYVVAANCPMLTVGSGQTLTCDWVAKPSFNPSGGQVSATARYINTNNGAAPSGTTKDYTSAPSVIPGVGDKSDKSGSSSAITGSGTFGRRLSQWSSFNPLSFMDQMWGHSSSSLVNAPAAAASHKSAAATRAPATRSPAAAAAPVPVAVPVATPDPPPVAASYTASVRPAFVSAPAPAPAVAAPAPVPTLIAAPVPFTATYKQAPAAPASTASYAVPAAIFAPSGSSNLGWNFNGGSSVLGSSSYNSNMRLAAPSVPDQDNVYSSSSSSGSSTSSSSNNGPGGSVSSISSMRAAAPPLPGSDMPPQAPVAVLDSAYPLLAESPVWQAGPPENTSGSSSMPYPVVTGFSSLPLAPAALGGSSISNPAGSTMNFLPLSAPASGAAGSSSSSSASSGGFTGEAPSGLLDECIDVSDAEGAGAGLVQGVLISGQRPSAQICSTTSFIYNVRYGPFTTCSNATKATNTAAFTTKDTKTRGESSTEVPVDVYGCGPPLVATVTNASTAADVGYKWSIEMRARASNLTLQLNKAGDNTYTTSYKRAVVASNPMLNVTVALRNPEATPVAVSRAVYSVNTTCAGQQTIKSDIVNCGSAQIAGYGSSSCSFAVPLGCVSNGTVGVNFVTSTGKFIAAAPVKFSAPSEKVVGKPADSCVTVGHIWSTGWSASLVSGSVVKGAAPKGTICGDKSFTFTAKFGPFKACDSMQAITAHSFQDSSGNVTQAIHKTNLDITGCSAARLSVPPAAAVTPAPGAAALNSLLLLPGPAVISTAAKAATAPTAAATSAGPCVRVKWFWRTCLTATEPDPMCSVIDRSLPGGLGADTPFFNLKHAVKKRTYRSVLLASTNTSNASVNAYIKAAQAYVAAQLNLLSGAAMPPSVRQAQIFLATKYFSVVTERNAVKPDLQKKVTAAVALLNGYNTGRIKGIPSCKKRLLSMRLF